MGRKMRRFIPFVLAVTALMVSAVPATADPPIKKDDLGCKGQSSAISADGSGYPDVDANGDGIICLTEGNNGTVTIKDNLLHKEIKK